jgi:hypothetical protein
MSIKVKTERQIQPNSALINPNSHSFNFDLWAKAVRCQMLVVLHKKSLD